jgi:plastocyanin
MRPSSLRRTALLAPVLGVALISPPAPAGAATTTVVVDNMAFSPSVVTVTLGNSVTWSFRELHTSTSNQGFWNSGQKSSGTFVKTFLDSGNYAYHCTLHAHMTGTVKVPIKSFGSASNGYALRWSSRTSTPSGWHYDVQVKPPGASQWVWYRQSTTTRTATFNPSRVGTYAMRVRTHSSGGGTSAFSTVLFLKIT